MSEQKEKEEVNLFKIDFSRVFKTWAIVDGDTAEDASKFVQMTFDPEKQFNLTILSAVPVTREEAENIIEAAEEQKQEPSPRPTLN